MIREELEEKLEDEQSAFRKERSTQDHLFLVIQIIEKPKKKVKGSDSVNRLKIWNALIREE